jgi:hypothetical protein
MTTTTTMAAVQHSDPAGLQSLARRFKTWRASRPRGQRIPEELWQAATDLARVHGLNPTVAALKLNYYDLQRRLHNDPACRRGSPPAPVFVEVPPVSLSPGGGERGLVELVHAGGARLILHRCAAGSGELLALVELFLRHGR